MSDRQPDFTVADKMLSGGGFSQLPEILGTMGNRELQTALLEAFALRAGKLGVADVLHQYETNEFIAASELGQREVIAFENLAAEVIPDTFDLIALSPVTALGSNSVLSTVSQRTVMATSRNTEVIADGVTALALEIAQRRRQTPAGTTEMHVGTFHREMRTQQHKMPGFTPHFHALSLVSSERTATPEEFNARMFAAHTLTYLDIIHRAAEIGYQADQVEVAFSNVRCMSLLASILGVDREELVRTTRLPGFNPLEAWGVPLPGKLSTSDLPEAIRSLPPHLQPLARPLMHMGRVFAATIDKISARYGGAVKVCFDLGRHAGIGYYQGLAVKITAANSEGTAFPLVDIGTNNWLAKLISNKKERLMTGGMGTELFMKQFKGSSAAGTGL